MGTNIYMHFVWLTPWQNRWFFVTSPRVVLVWEDNCPHLSVKRTNIKTLTLLRTQNNAKRQVNCVYTLWICNHECNDTTVRVQNNEPRLFHIHLVFLPSFEKNTLPTQRFKVFKCFIKCPSVGTKHSDSTVGFNLKVFFKGLLIFYRCLLIYQYIKIITPAKKSKWWYTVSTYPVRRK